MLAIMAAEFSPELAFLLEREGVVAEFKDGLKRFSINTLAKFAALVASQEEMRGMLKDDFQLDARAGNMEVKAKVSAILVAWTSAKARSEKRAEQEGEAEARNEAKKIPVGDHLAMRAAFEAQYWALEDKGVPGKAYLEKLLDRIEKNDLRSELLSEVLSVDDDGDDSLKQRVPLPSNPEQLRRRVKIMGAAWAMCALSHGSQPYLANFDVHVWAAYADYLMGEFVLGFVQDEEGAEVTYQDWEIVLVFEYQVRREMAKRMLKGTEMHKALREAMEDSKVRGRYLVTPLQKRNLQSKRSNSGAAEGHAHKKPKSKGQEKGKNKGTDKGKGKGKSLSLSAGCADKTPDGNRVCYAFNNRGEGCKRTSCPFAHVCGVCFKKGRPMYDCDHKPAQG